MTCPATDPPILCDVCRRRIADTEPIVVDLFGTPTHADCVPLDAA